MDNDYSEDQVKLHNRIKKMTSRIGKAKKAGDMGSITNYRNSRNRMLHALAEQFDTYYWVDTDGKSQFGSLEEAKGNVDPEKIKAAAITTHLYDTLKSYHKTRVKYRAMTGDELKEFILDNLDKGIDSAKEELHKTQEDVGESKADLSFLEDDGGLEGIDWDSLNDDNSSDEETPTPGVIEEASDEPEADEPEAEDTNS